MKIVIVDDHPLVRKGLMAVLSQEEDLEVVGESETVEEAMQLITETQSDLAIVDVRLGSRSGFELAEQLRDRACRVLMLTSSSTEADIRRAEACGAYGYMLKEAMPEELLLAVKMLEKGKKYFDQGLLEVMIRRDSDDPLEKLTPKEREVLVALGEGATNGAIAKRLTVSEFTVKKHVSSIFQKLQLSDRTQAALYAQSRGLADFSPPAADERSEQVRTP